jgi:hypothetical protein
MDVVGKGTHSLRKAIRTWNILANSFFNHLNGKTISREMGPRGMLTT